MTENIEIIPLDSPVEEPEKTIDIKTEETKCEIAPEEKPKKARGRPKGKAAPKPVPIVKPKKSKQVRYEEESDEELPAYVQPIVAPRQPVDLASQMLTLLQNHAVLKQERKRALYQSWFRRVH